MGAMCAVTLAMVGCEKTPDIINPGDNNGGNGEDIECPIVNAPEAGKTTMVVYVPENTHSNGIYAVGTVNSWAEKDTETCKFTKVEGDDTGRWYQLTVDYAADMAIKVCAIPSKPALAGWSFQWGKNVDDKDPDPAITEDNVVTLKGTVTIELENQGQPKATGFEDGGVVFMQIKAWAADPNIKEEPATAISFKHPWGGGEWEYKQAEAKGNNVFELQDVYGNNGFNVMDENGAESWFQTTDCQIYDGAATGDKVIVRFTSRAGAAEGDLEVILVEKGEVGPTPEPVIVTVRAKWPAAWTEIPTAHVWSTGAAGTDVTLEQDGEFYKYTTPEAVTGLNIIFKNGPTWDKGQTVDITNILVDTDYEIIVPETGKATVNVIK